MCIVGLSQFNVKMIGVCGIGLLCFNNMGGCVNGRVLYIKNVLLNLPAVPSDLSRCIGNRDECCNVFIEPTTKTDCMSIYSDTYTVCCLHTFQQGMDGTGVSVLMKYNGGVQFSLNNLSGSSSCILHSLFVCAFFRACIVFLKSIVYILAFQSFLRLEREAFCCH